MQTYKDAVDRLQEELNQARRALARDVATAVETADWKFFRDKYDVEVLVKRVAELGRQRKWRARLHALGDCAREQGSKCGRPRKTNKATSQATGPAAGAAGEAT